MNWSLSDIARVLAVPLALPEPVLVQRVVTDSRVVQVGDLFVALVGERVDGHDFLVQVVEQGAVAVLVTRVPTHPLSVPYLLVEDAVAAMQTLAGAWRAQQSLSPVIVVTGSNGKTSVKELLAAGLSCCNGSAVLATQGNLNNHLGLPMTLLSLTRDHHSAVIEVGANHVGEIAVLAPLAQPTIAIVTSIARAHIGEFGSLAKIMQAKGEIWSALPVASGVAIVPAVAEGSEFDAWPLWKAPLSGHRVVAFGELADVQLDRGWHDWVAVVARVATERGQRIQLRSSRWGDAEIDLPLLGAHQARNAAAAAAALLESGLSWAQIQSGLAQVSLPGGRLRKLNPLPGLTIIDDSYNANASSMQAAISVLMEQPAQHYAFVMGAMGELGDEAEALHRQVVMAARQAGVHQLYVAGEFAPSLAALFGQGIASDDPNRIAACLWQHYQQDGSLAVLIKGSRSARMERVVNALLMLSQQQCNAFVEEVGKR